ncbi:acyl-CoA thioesterase [Gallaecimonas mangrovi]|uniref:acyl-CoA thioesterase n=1 Tax=Gallaecimonas mangrovi TaxID=2291597 RepID=UPI000E206FE7|nr:acyl-CoA thioesterase [Gallaecimonas mangrovi]
MARSPLQFPSKVLFECPLSLRISDINYGQHLGHDTLVSLCHEGRCRWLAAHGMTEGNIDGAAQVVAELSVNYLAQAFYPEQLTMALAVGDLSSKGAEIFQQLRREDGVIVAISKVSVVFFDVKAQAPVAIPEAFKALL